MVIKHLQEYCGRTFLFAFMAINMIWLLPGCQTARLGPPPAITYEPAQKPNFYILYYPYGPALTRDIARPLPNYSGWTDERMGKDLRRIKAIGLDVVLLAINLADFEEAYQKERYDRFFQVAENNSDELKVAIWLYNDDVAGLVDDAGASIQGVLEWHLMARIGEFSSTYKLGNRPLIVLSPDLSNVSASHPAFRLLRTSGIGTEWTWESPTLPHDSAALFNSSGEQAVVYSGWYSKNNWVIPRNSGRTLRKALWSAFRKRSRNICVSSWNDFAAGSFVEPNSLDGEVVVRVLAEEIERVKHALQSSLND